jgi:L-ascorbate metabolism protein UlaG (beta-lactamase superfamily)
MPIGAYNPWIHSRCTPEQAVQIGNEAGAHFIMPVHHQTFHLSVEGFREPIERVQAALHKTPERIALREIGETFVLQYMPTKPRRGRRAGGFTDPRISSR